MGEMLMNMWEKQETNNMEMNTYCEHFYYYRRRMGCGPAGTKIYNANVFICTFSDIEQLLKNWKDINYTIAFHVQNKCEEIIEKSNYYICLFVSDMLDINEKNMIQNNSFCAKKYVFEGNIGNEAECVERVEKRIFSISLENNMPVTPKIQQIELQNFRGYEGNLKIDLTSKYRKAAAFTLLYAKNGYGKTSLFDGLEYVFKGEVNRIVELEMVNRKEPLKGPVYHNKNRADKKAYTRIQLDNGKEIYRKVTDVEKDKNDCKMTAVDITKGREIVGLKDTKEKWNQIILPHDRIDSFISAHTPSAKYIEWTKSASDLKKEQDVFVEAHNKLGKHQKSLRNKNIELETLEKDLLKLEQSKKEIAKLEELCTQYNGLVNEDSKLSFNSTNYNIKEYDFLLNEIARKIRKIKNDILPIYDSYVNIGLEMLNTEINDAERLEESLGAVHFKKNNYSNQIESNEQYVIAKERINEIQREMVELQTEKAPLDSIFQYGLDKIMEETIKFNRLEKEINAMAETINYFDSEIQKVIDLNNDLTERINTLEKNINSEDKTRTVLEYIQVISDLEIELDSQIQELKNLETGLELISEEIEQRSLMLERIKSFKLPKELKDMALVDKNEAEVILSLKERLFLEQFEFRLLDMENELKLREEILNQENVITEEIREISDMGNKFLLSHKDYSICPLCKTEFSNWEELFANVSRVEELKEEHHQKKIQEIIEGIKNLYLEYEKFYKKFASQKESKQTKILDEIMSLSEERGSRINQKEKLQQEIEQVRQKIRIHKERLENQNIYLLNYSVEGWQKYVIEKREEIENLNLQKNELNNKKNNLKELNANNQMINSAKIEEKESIVNDSQLYSHILFFNSKPDDYNWEYERNALAGHIYTLKKEKEQKEMVLERNKDCAQIDLLECKHMIERCDNELEHLQQIKEKASIFSEFSPEGIKNSLKLWKNEKQNYEKQLEILMQMNEESGARAYYEKYKEILEGLNKTKKEIEEDVEIEKTLKGDFESKKDNLEKLLKDYFSQPVMNEIFQKIDPHDIMKNITYHIEFSENDEPQLFIKVCEPDETDGGFYRPEVYFSTAQLNTVAFSSFFGRALAAKDIGVKTICVDDPIGHFDDMNILGFTDMIRCILESQDCQIIMSTHDEKVFQIMQRKLNADYYNTSFIRLADSEKVRWDKELGLEMK